MYELNTYNFTYDISKNKHTYIFVFFVVKYLYAKYAKTIIIKDDNGNPTIPPLFTPVLVG